MRAREREGTTAEGHGKSLSVNCISLSQKANYTNHDDAHCGRLELLSRVEDGW